MPQFQGRRTLAANERGVDVLATWQYRILPWRALVRFGIHTTAAAAGAQMSLVSGSNNMVQTCQIGNGATDGVMPSPLNVPYFEFVGEAGDTISTSIDELLAVATTDCMFFVSVDPYNG